jgi:hypothetical protein
LTLPLLLGASLPLRVAGLRAVVEVRLAERCVALVPLASRWLRVRRRGPGPVEDASLCWRRLVRRGCAGVVASLFCMRRAERRRTSRVRADRWERWRWDRAVASGAPAVAGSLGVSPAAGAASVAAGPLVAIVGRSALSSGM